MLSDVYEFWPPNITFGVPVTLSIDCVSTNEGEEVILKVDGNHDVPLLKDKTTPTYVNKKIALPSQAKEDQQVCCFQVVSLSTSTQAQVAIPQILVVGVVGQKVQHI